MDRTGLLAEVRDLAPVRGHAHRFGLTAGARELARRLDQPGTDPQWPERAHGLVSGLRRALADHVELTERAYAEVANAAPRLAPHVRQLIRDHADLADALAVLQHCLDRPGEPAAARGPAADLLLLLARHRQRGADLLYAAYTTDLGGET